MTHETMPNKGFRAVTFDYWRTLIFEPPGELERVRVDKLLSILSEAGFHVSSEQLRAAHAIAFDKASASWRANQQYRAEHAAADIMKHLGLQPPPAVLEAAIGGFSEAGLKTSLQLSDGVEDALRRLRSAGIQLGIVCDVGLTPSPVLREHLARLRLLELFDHWSFSDETGEYKPHNLPFAHACEGLGVSPRDVAHVGDQRRTDIVGAMAAGMTAVRYTGVFDDQDESLPTGDLVLNDFHLLLGALGLR